MKYILLVLIIFLPLSISGGISSLSISISTVKLDDTTDFDLDSPYITLSITLTIENPSNEEQVVTHNDGCGFKVKMESSDPPDRVTGIFPYYCTMAIVTENIPSGQIERQTTFIIKSIDENISELPEVIFVIVPDVDPSEFTSINSATISYHDSQIDVFYDHELTSDSSDANFSLVLSSILIVSGIQLKRNKAHKKR